MTACIEQHQDHRLGVGIEYRVDRHSVVHGYREVGIQPASEEKHSTNLRFFQTEKRLREREAQSISQKNNFLGLSSSQARQVNNDGGF